MSERHFKGVWIPKAIWEGDLSWFDKCLLAEIDCLDDGAGCHASNLHLAERMGSTQESVKVKISMLKSGGWIVALDEGLFDRKIAVAIGGVRLMPINQALMPINRKLTGINRDGGYHIKDKLPDKSTPQIKAEEIYDAYPLKVGRKKALASIRKCLVKEKPEKLLETTQNFAKLWASHPMDFCPHPSTWFNQERYLDPLELQKPHDQNGNKPNQNGIFNHRNFGTAGDAAKRKAGVGAAARAANGNSAAKTIPPA